MRSCLGCLGTFVVLLAVVAGGSLLYILGPDLPPIRLALPAVEDLPLVGTPEKEVPDPSPEAMAYTEALLAEGGQAIGAGRAPVLAILKSLQAAGLPMQGAALETTTDGRRTLLLLAPYAGSSVGIGPTGLARGFQQVMRLAELKEIDLSSIDEIVLTLQDGQGRTLFGIAAPTSSITAYQAGQATKAELIRSMAVKAESRAAILDAVASEVGS